MRVYILQVRETAVTALVEVYRHVGERVRADLGKRGLPAARSVCLTLFHSHAHTFFAFFCQIYFTIKSQKGIEEQSVTFTYDMSGSVSKFSTS